MRIAEKLLILPALYIIDNNISVIMSDLIRELSTVFNPTGEDAEILAGRNDTKFSQIVRNLKSHRPINRMEKFTNLTDNKYSLTEEGEKYLHANYSAMEYLFSNKFKYEDVQNVVEAATKTCDAKKTLYTYDENDMISEGQTNRSETITKERSRKLRKAAIEHYTRENSKIYCEVCEFCFEDIYGELGQGFIEIHHEEPLFQYPDEGFESYIEDAIEKMKPVCSNCHSMIHRNLKSPLNITDLKAMIDNNNPNS